jgi:hypothetical protein
MTYAAGNVMLAGSQALKAPEHACMRCGLSCEDENGIIYKHGACMFSLALAIALTLLDIGGAMMQ